jgi:molybdopterin-guanine dinucleotide biosynthesis protein A
VADITGLVLCGGRGARMGGVDKGLQLHHGLPLALHALRRLAPQVGPLMISANRNLTAYAAMGVPVWPDSRPDHPGPLAGMLAGLEHCQTPWLLSVPCDAPDFPADLAARLLAALRAADADIAIAATEQQAVLQLQPVFCLLRATLATDLAASLRQGERSVERWTAHHRRATAVFDDAAAFFNANTPQDLSRLAGAAKGAQPGPF